MDEMQDFHNLKVWKKSHQLTLSIYTATANYPKEEIYGLTSQLRRASASIPTNLAEGCGRGSDPDFLRFLWIAMGSASELEYLLLISRDLDYLQPTIHQSLCRDVIEVKQMLASLIKKVKGENKKLIAES